MKNLTAGVFTVLMGLVSVNSAYAAVASKGYVDKQIGLSNAAITAMDAAYKEADTGMQQSIEKNTTDIATNAEKIGSATFTDANYVSTAESLTDAVTALDTAVKNVAGGNLQLGKDAVDSNVIKDGAVNTIDIANGAVTEDKLADAVKNSISEKQTATQVTTAINGALADYTTTSAMNDLLETKADKLTTYNKTEVDDMVAGKVKELADGAVATNTAAITAMDAAYKEADAALGARIDGLTGNGEQAAATNKDLQDAIAAEVARADAAYETKGAAATAESAAKSYTDTGVAGAKTYAKEYTDQKVAGLKLAEISRVPAACSDQTNYCVLTTNGTNFVWEVIARDDDVEAPSTQTGSERLEVTVPEVTEPTVTQ